MEQQTVAGPPSWLRDALGAARTPRARKLARAVTLGAAAWEVGRKAQSWGKGRVTYTVRVPGTDEAYDLVVAWMTEQVPPRARRSLSVRTRRRFSDSEIQPVLPGGSNRVEASPLRVEYDGTAAQTVRIGGHRVSVSIERGSQTDGLSLSVNTSGDSAWERTFQRIAFTCLGASARDAVLGFLDDLTAEARNASTSRPRMYVAQRWGDWRRIHEINPRSLSTVILVDGQTDRIVGDLERFQAAESLYARVGIPWHRGYLFHGPPGCGKTSLATALADRFGLDVYLLPLSDLDADVNLLSLLAGVDPRSVLVIEDIDVVHAAKARDDAERKGVTLSGLLNALDGLATPHGLITIMTTNRLDSLDPALVRPGRADLVEYFGPLDDDQAARLANLVEPTERPVDGATIKQAHVPGVDGATITHAELLEAAKPYLDEPSRAVDAMRERIWQARAETPAVR